MRIDVTIDDSHLQTLMGLRAKSLPFAAVNGLNSTIERMRGAGQQHVREKFVIRKQRLFFGSPGRPGGVGGSVQFASVRLNRPFAEVYLGDVSGGRLLFPMFEEGGLREPFTPGAKHIAAPVLGRPARPTISRGVPPQFTFQGLAFREFRAGRRVRRARRGRTVGNTVFTEFGRVLLPEREQGVQWKGRERTFIIPDVGVFQRFGPDRGDIRLIYGFLAPFRLDGRLDAVRVWRETADRWFHEEMERQVIDALAHAPIQSTRAT